MLKATFFLFLFLMTMGNLFAQSLVISWQTPSDKSIVQVKTPDGKIKEYQVAAKSFAIPITTLGNYYWRVKADEKNQKSEFSEWALIEATDSIFNVEKALMTAPPDNSGINISGDEKTIVLNFERPKKKWQYFIEVFQDNAKIVDKKIDENSLTITVPKAASEIRWRVLAKSKYGNVTKTDNFWKINLAYRPPPLKISAEAKDDKTLLSWKPQIDCSSYTIFQDDKKLIETKATKIGMKIEPNQIIKVMCSQNKYLYGLISIKRVKKSGLFYQFNLTQLQLSLIAPEALLTPATFEKSYLLQFHGLGYHFYLGEDNKHEIRPIVRYGKMLDFSDDISVLRVSGLLKWAPFNDTEKKILAEVKHTRIDYIHTEGVSVNQVMNFYGIGYETPFLDPRFKLSGLINKTNSSSDPSFEVRTAYEASKRISLSLDFEYNVANPVLDTGEATDTAETKVLLLELGLIFNF